MQIQSGRTLALKATREKYLQDTVSQGLRSTDHSLQIFLSICFAFRQNLFDCSLNVAVLLLDE
jgi:hypothetical protein